jgi:monoterpene epsilon-lactone hydrolase
MPSMQSYILRAFVKLLSMRMNSMTSVPRLRAFTEKVSRSRRLPKGTHIERPTLNGINVEWIAPNGPVPKSVILYLHGGAWVLGWYHNHRVLAAYIGQASRSRVIAVDYRLAPEHPFPASLDDCLTIYRRLINDGIKPGHIVIAGDSAGANLTLAVLFTLRDAGEPLPAAAVCISPMTDLAFTGRSYHTQKDVLLTEEFARSMSRHYLGNQDVCNPLISPHYGDLTGLPPLLIHAGKDEILLNDAERLTDNARHAGVDVTLTVWPKMWHVWHILAPYLPEATQAINEIGSFVLRHIASKTVVAK